MVFSLEHDIKVTKNHQNLLPTQSVLVAHTVLGNYKFLIPFNVILEEFNKNKATILEFTTKIVSRIAKIEQFVHYSAVSTHDYA
jgi:hypothetical protein